MGRVAISALSYPKTSFRMSAICRTCRLFSIVCEADCTFANLRLFIVTLPHLRSAQRCLYMFLVIRTCALLFMVVTWTAICTVVGCPRRWIFHMAPMYSLFLDWTCHERNS